MKKPKFLVIILALIVILGFIILSIKNDGNDFETIKVERGNIVNEIFESGSTKKGNEINLSFKEGGKIDKFLINEGEELKKGDIIAELDKSELNISLKEAYANLSLAKADLENLLSGATEEELNIYKSSVNAAEDSFLSAKNNLEKQKEITDEKLREVYQPVPALLGDIYSLTSSIQLDILDITRKYFTGVYVLETRQGIKNRDAIERNVEDIKKYKDFINNEDVTFLKKEDALKDTEEKLKKIITEIDGLINVIESDFYTDKFTKTEKDLIRQYRTEVNEILNKTNSLVGTISLVNAEVNSTLTSAKANVTSTQNALDKAKKELLRIKSEPRETEIIIKKSAVDIAKSKIELLEEKIKNSTLKSPVDGIVSDVLARNAEVVSAGSPIVVIVPDKDIKVTLDIYEGDILNVSSGDKVFASFVAFSDKEFTGEVVFINPVGKFKDGVVYYSVDIILDEYPKNVLPQMTVDITIRTDEKKDVLIVSERAVFTENNKKYVKVIENGEKIKTEIELGLRGEGRYVEVLSGLKEGDLVIIN